MFEFQAYRNDPEALLDVLERFTRWWFSAPPGEETSISEERLKLVSLPLPLRKLYAFAGQWPGGQFESIFSHQDHLSPFEWLEVRDGKLIFAWENQGTWCVATDPSGDDPPVYVSDDGSPFQRFGDSLAQFLVTFCLHETVFGAECLSLVSDLGAVNASHSKLPIPLWLDGPYVPLSGKARQFSFHLVDGCILQMDGWCGGRHAGLDKTYPDFFPTNDSHRPQLTGPSRHLWEIPEVPTFIKTQHIEMLVRRHEQLSESHLEKPRSTENCSRRSTPRRRRWTRGARTTLPNVGHFQRMKHPVRTPLHGRQHGQQRPRFPIPSLLQGVVCWNVLAAAECRNVR